MFKAYLKRFDAEAFSFQTFDPADPEAWERFLDEYARIFRPIGQEVFVWYYEGRENFFGELWTNGRLIGLYGLLPITLNSYGNCFSGNLCHNVGIDPEFGGKGLFQYIGDLALHESKKRGYGVALGFPNKASYKGHLRLGWETLGEVRFYEKRSFRIASEPSGYRFDHLTVFDDVVDRFAREIYRRYSFSLCKESAYLNWRMKRPGARYDAYGLYTEGGAMAGYCILKRFEADGEKRLHLVDYLFADEKTATILLEQVEGIAAREGVDLLNTWAVKEGEDAAWMLASDWEMSESGYPVIVFFSNGEADYSWGEAMHFTLFDNDVF